jgi:hypothetical protein
MPRPLGGANTAPLACTLTRSALPRRRFAFEKLIVVGLGAPLVLRLTSVTAKLTVEGTVTLTVSCAAADTADAVMAAMPSIAIRIASDPADGSVITVRSFASGSACLLVRP